MIKCRILGHSPIMGVLFKVIFPDDMVFKILDNLSFAEGAMVEPLAVGMQRN